MKRNITKHWNICEFVTFTNENIFDYRDDGFIYIKTRHNNSIKREKCNKVFFL